MVREMTGPKPAFDLGAMLAMRITWQDSSDLDLPWSCEYNGVRLEIRLNDFPDEPLYSLIADSEDLGSFNDWPESWTRPSRR